MKKDNLEKCKHYERLILKAQGFTEPEFEVDECQLSQSAHIHYVRIKTTKQTKNNVLLMAHGYMGSNISFFRLYKLLKRDFHIFSIDIPGQGLSSSRNDIPQSAQGWVDYFVSSIKAFCDKMGLERVSLCGHSLGGFVVTHFADAHPSMVQYLYLLSPGGVHR